MNPLYVERVQQYFLTEFVRDNPLSNSTVISERSGRDKKLVSIPVREEHMAKYWAIWKAILIAMLTMSTQRTFVPEITSERQNMPLVISSISKEHIWFPPNLVILTMCWKIVLNTSKINNRPCESIPNWNTYGSYKVWLVIYSALKIVI